VIFLSFPINNISPCLDGSTSAITRKSWQAVCFDLNSDSGQKIMELLVETPESYGTSNEVGHIADQTMNGGTTIRNDQNSKSAHLMSAIMLVYGTYRVFWVP
jgi:hypothetical protein